MTDKAMSTIMKLLNLAADDSATAAERELAAEQAERLMAKHQIERFEAEQAARASGHKTRTVICDEWELNVGAMGQDRNYEYSSTISSLMGEVLGYCGARMNFNWDYKRNQEPQYHEDKFIRSATLYHGIRIYKIVGYAEDIAYAERMWFRIYKEFVTNVNPHWLPGPDKLGENCYNYTRAAYKWADIWRLAYRYQEAMRDTMPGPWNYITPKGKPREIPDPFSTKYAPMLKASVKEYCASIGIEYVPHTQRHDIYKASFARSYSSTIGQRLRKQRTEASKAHGDDLGVDENQFALARLDTKETVDAEFYRLFPEYDPEVQKRRQEQRDMNAWLKAEALWNSLDDAEKLEAIKQLIEEEAKAQKELAKQEAKDRRYYNSYRSRAYTNNYDYAAWERGKAVASNVNLRDDTEVKDRDDEELQNRRALK